MHESTQEPISGGLVHVERYVAYPGDVKRLDAPEVYQPCEGTWAEFKGDVRRTLTKAKSDIQDRREDLSERWNRVFRRNRADQDSLHNT